jgi:hypothetical protein
VTPRASHRVKCQYTVSHGGKSTGNCRHCRTTATYDVQDRVHNRASRVSLRTYHPPDRSHRTVQPCPSHDQLHRSAAIRPLPSVAVDVPMSVRSCRNESAAAPRRGSGLPLRGRPSHAELVPAGSSSITRPSPSDVRWSSEIFAPAPEGGRPPCHGPGHLAVPHRCNAWVLAVASRADRETIRGQRSVDAGPAESFGCLRAQRVARYRIAVQGGLPDVVGGHP